jgi:hypothetical protein
MNELDIKHLRILSGKLLKEYLSKKIDYEEFIKRLPHEDVDESISMAIHAAQHFYCDADIRANDKDYEDLLINDLLAMSDSLEKGEDFKSNKFGFYKARRLG